MHNHCECRAEGARDEGARDENAIDERSVDDRDRTCAEVGSDERVASDPLVTPLAILGWRTSFESTPASCNTLSVAPETNRHDVLRTAHVWTQALERHASFLRSCAWQLAWYDRDLREDLEQEERIALWKLDPVKVDAAWHRAGYERAAIRHAMLRFLRVTARQDPGDRRIDWRIVEEVLETFGERRPGRRRAA